MRSAYNSRIWSVLLVLKWRATINDSIYRIHYFEVEV